MPALTEADTGWWLITYRDKQRPPERAEGAYVTSSDKSLPGHTVLKTWRHKAVVAVPSDALLSITRETI